MNWMHPLNEENRHARYPFLKFIFTLGCFVLPLTPGLGIGGGINFTKMTYVASDKSENGRQSGFYIDQYEVTQTEYFKVMSTNPSFFKGENRPVEKVTWNQANAYCDKIGKRLPTEQEWEKAVRAGTASKYFWGEKQADHYAWHKGNSGKQTHEVGTKEPNAWGLYDMAGNVWEWTDSDHERSGKVVRGGSWRNGVGSLQSSHRISSLPIHKFHYIGFRCAVSKYARE